MEIQQMIWNQWQHERAASTFSSPKIKADPHQSQIIFPRQILQVLFILDSLMQQWFH